MVRILSSVFSALLLSSVALAVPTMEKSEPAPAMYEPSMAEPAMAATSSAMMPEASPEKPMKEGKTSSAMHEATTTTPMAHEAMSTPAMKDETSSAPAAATSAAANYGSGSSNWGTDLNSCVQMCQAKFGMGSGSSGSLPPSTTSAPAAGAGGGATHTVIVAPTKGVLRYVPFAVNASVGDTVRFMWGAGPHTVTKSSALTVCNKSADASTFASGQQNASFVFDQVVNNTEPTFYYCAVPTHCQKGMFGIINPPSAPAGAATSVGMMMSTWTSQNPDLAKIQSAVDAMTINTPAYNWASNMDSASIPVEAQQSLMENVMYTRSFYAANPGAEQGASRPDGQPLSIPADVSTLLQGTAGNPAGASGSVPAGTPTGTTAAASTTPKVNGAQGVMASSALIAAVAVFSSLFLF